MRKNAALMFLLCSVLTALCGQNVLAQTQDAEENRAKIDKRSQKLAKKNVIRNFYIQPNKRDYEAIALDAAYLDKYANFLKTPNTGLIKLHDAANCEQNNRIVDVAEPCPSGFILGKATAYSFRTQKYRTPNFSDLQLYKKALYTVGFNSQGIIAKIGDVTLENVSNRSAELKHLLEFVPSADEAAITREFKTFQRGVRAGGYVFQKAVVIKKDETYLLRTIAYKSKILQRRGPFKINILADDKRDDVCIAFRILDVNEDGSVVILWKEVERKPAPKLIYQKQLTAQSKQ